MPRLCTARRGLLLQGFDPNVGLFVATSDNRLYPNPEAPALVPEALQLLEFLGRMLGKVCTACTGFNMLTTSHLLSSFVLCASLRLWRVWFSVRSSRYAAP